MRTLPTKFSKSSRIYRRTPANTSKPRRKIKTQAVPTHTTTQVPTAVSQLESHIGSNIVNCFDLIMDFIEKDKNHFDDENEQENKKILVDTFIKKNNPKRLEIYDRLFQKRRKYQCKFENNLQSLLSTYLLVEDWVKTLFKPGNIFPTVININPREPGIFKAQENLDQLQFLLKNLKDIFKTVNHFNSKSKNIYDINYLVSVMHNYNTRLEFICFEIQRIKLKLLVENWEHLSRLNNN